ncbi:MAG TPA: hypothetical protein VLC28_03795 [Flavitalea sp.]|nr:hypothetical protein [Flavitalea sp.]
MKSNLFLLFILFLFNASAQTKDSTFHEQEIVLTTATGKIYGTLTLPQETKKLPVVLIIAGSGPTDRDGNNSMMKNDALKLIAHGLAANQIASVRFDKRLIAESKSSSFSEADIRFETYINDASDWITLLKKDGRFKETTVIGHSEGSLIGMLTKEKPDRLISIAGVGFPAAAVLKKQLASQPDAVKNISYEILDSLSAGRKVDSIPPFLGSLFRPSVQPYLISWFKYDPSVAINALKIPTLIIQGTTDIQVDTSDAKQLARSNPAAQLVIIDGMNHVLKTTVIDRKENLKTYFDPSLPLADKLIPTITGFVKAKM